MSPARQIIVFDLDGTLALDHHRSHHLKSEKKDWEQYFSLCHLDEPNLPVIAILDSLDIAGFDIHIWTGRSASTREKTEHWLAMHICNWPEAKLKMRGADDRTNDHDLKLSWLNEMRVAGYSVMLAFEDRQRVVDMWRAEGVVCCQVAPGQF